MVETDPLAISYVVRVASRKNRRKAIGAGESGLLEEY
jgi:hypothetical protein